MASASCPLTCTSIFFFNLGLKCNNCISTTMDPFMPRRERPMPIHNMAAYCSRRKNDLAQALPPPVPRLRIRGSTPQDTTTTRIRRIGNAPGQDTCRCSSPELSFAPVPLESFDSYSDGPLARGSLICKICGKRRDRRPAVHQTQESPVFEHSFQGQDRGRQDLDPTSPDSDISSSYTIVSSGRPRKTDQRYTRAPTGQFSDDSSFSDNSTNPEQERKTSYTQQPLPRDRYYTSPRYDSSTSRLQEGREAEAEPIDDEPWAFYESRTTYYQTPTTRPHERRQEYCQPRGNNAVHRRPLVRDDSEATSRVPHELSPIRQSERRPKREGRDLVENRYLREERAPRDKSYFMDDRYSGEEMYPRKENLSRNGWVPHRRDDFLARPKFDNNFKRLPAAIDETNTRRTRGMWDERERSRFSPEVTSEEDVFDSSQVRYVSSRDWPRRIEDNDGTSRSTNSDSRDEQKPERVRRLVVVDGW
ncbi:hypothetical protein BDZ45DRAFT_724976 [Acephala macrosclerotiorum]|nr:hypothetical protein BDZ45DRAFT_724976 [Acephala macrosclerotiorum]